MGNKYAVKAVDGDDLISALQAIEKDTGCKARIIIRLDRGDELACRVEAYTEQEGVRMGVATDTIWWAIGNGKLLARAMIALHRVYSQADRLAHKSLTSR